MTWPVPKPLCYTRWVSPRWKCGNVFGMTSPNTTRDWYSFLHLGNCRAPRAASCILRWKDRRYMFVPQDQWSLRRKSTLHRCHFWISVGEQIQNLSRGTPTDFKKSSDRWSIRLLWHRQSGYCTTRRIVQSCLTPSKWRKIDFSVMLYLCGTTTSKTDARPPMDLYSHPSRTPHPQYVVYTWNQ